MGGDTLRQIDSQLTRDKIVAVLRQEILYGNLKPNQELYQDRIAEELNVSRMPVREAIQVLANEGLVNARPNKVATVNEVTDKFISDFFDVRVLLEKEAVRRVCLRENLDTAPLWDYYEKACHCIEMDDYNQYNEYNQKIHQFIWHAADNIKLEQLLAQLWHTMYVGSYAKENAFCSNEGHRSIIQGIEDRDVEAAQRATEAHLLFSLKNMRERRLYQKSTEGRL